MAVWRVFLLGKHGLDCASAGAIDAMMMVARTADWNLGIMIDDDDDDVGLTFWRLLTRQVAVIYVLIEGCHSFSSCRIANPITSKASFQSIMVRETATEISPVIT